MRAHTPEQKAKAIAKWHRQNNALAAQLTSEADRKKERKARMAKKKPTDLTLRNARASKARDAMLAARIKRVEDRVKKLEAR